MLSMKAVLRKGMNGATAVSLAAVLILAVVPASMAVPLAQSGPSCPAGQEARFAFGFAFLKNQLGPVVGDPLDCEHYDKAGNAYQTTTTGTLFYRKNTNTATFTDGNQHFAWTSRGLVQWTGSLTDPPADVTGGPPLTDIQGIDQAAQQMVSDGRRIFRFDHFGDDVFWGDSLRLHQAIEGASLGGVGPGVSPKDALAIGLKVDAAALPADLVQQLSEGKINLDSPATTLALLKLDAVVGVKGFLNEQGSLRSIGITCALCHSTVDNSFAPGIGKRLDGWANRDLNVGAIIALAPNLQPLADVLGVDVATVKTVLNSWGPGKFDAELILDGKAARPDGRSGATLIPPAFGLAGVNLHTWTGWGSVAHWNAFVAVLEMHGQGTFLDSRLNDAQQFPVAARAGFGNVRNDPDLVTSKLPALHFYQLAIPAPRPPDGSFDKAAATRGQVLFNGKATCASCHVPPIFTEPGWNMHTPAEIGIDDFQAGRAPDKRYRTAPLRGLWTHTKGGFYHDGRFAALKDVVSHYDVFFKLGLTEPERNDLIEYLKSL